MPNNNRIRNNFYRSKAKIPVDFSIFLSKQTSFSLDDWFLKAEKILPIICQETLPINWKCYLFDLIFYESFTSNKIKSIRIAPHIRIAPTSPSSWQTDWDQETTRKPFHKPSSERKHHRTRPFVTASNGIRTKSPQTKTPRTKPPWTKSHLGQNPPGQNSLSIFHIYWQYYILITVVSEWVRIESSGLVNTRTSITCYVQLRFTTSSPSYPTKSSWTKSPSIFYNFIDSSKWVSE